MRLLFLICVVLAISEFAYAAVFYQPPAKKKGDDGKWYCDYQEKTNMMPGDSHKPKGECSMVFCNDDFSMLFESCGVASSDDCDYWGPDLTKVYPDCCNKICEKPVETNPKFNQILRQ